MARNFINKKFNAQNVLELDVDIAKIEKLKRIASYHAANCDYKSKKVRDFLHTKPKWSSNVTWISNNSLESYRSFLEFYNDIDLAEIMKSLIDHREKILLYNGQFIVRDLCQRENFHEDWSEPIHNNAFTFLTPLLHEEDGLNLVYRDLEGKVRAYKYALGKAIIIGSGFKHSTEVGKSKNKSILLALLFGTDIEGYAKAVRKDMGSQTAFMRLPGGNIYTGSRH